jgi:hypothetical protein
MNIRVVIVYIVLLYLIPEIFKSPTDVDVFDNIVLYASTSREFVIPAAVLLSLSLFITEKYFSE